MFGCLRIHLLFSCWVVSDSETLWTAACQASLSFTISWSFLRLMSIESLIPSNHFILCLALLLSSNLSPHQCIFQWVGSLYQVAKVLELQLQLQHQSFSMNIQGWFPLGLTDLIFSPFYLKKNFWMVVCRIMAFFVSLCL